MQIIESIRQAIPRFGIRTRLRQWRQVAALRRQTTDRLRSATRWESNAIRRLLIVPCDPWTLAGSKGDEAMLHAAVARLREASPDLEVLVFTASEQADISARKLGFRPSRQWDVGVGACIDEMVAFRPDAAFVLGADVMDGYYSPVTTAQMLNLARAASQLGARVCILGFSFNTKPSSLIRSSFEALPASVGINVRDARSLDRFSRFSRARGRLVADAAFMLRADRDCLGVEEVSTWADSQRRAGLRVLGVNLHPMLFKDASDDQINALVRGTAGALKALSSHKISLLLISHDYRGRSGDDTCLEPLHAMLQAQFVDRLCYPRGEFTAQQLKAMVGCADGVVTGRMHLAIASLGMGVPVVGLTYQDKFQGLMAHFNYPEAYLLPPASVCDPDKFAAVLGQFIEQMEPLRARVVAAMPAVGELSSLNLEMLWPPRTDTRVGAPSMSASDNLLSSAS